MWEKKEIKRDDCIAVTTSQSSKKTTREWNGKPWCGVCPGGPWSLDPGSQGQEWVTAWSRIQSRPTQPVNYRKETLQSEGKERSCPKRKFIPERGTGQSRRVRKMLRTPGCFPFFYWPGQGTRKYCQTSFKMVLALKNCKADSTGSTRASVFLLF